MFMEEGTGVEPASDKRAVVFKTTALPVRLPFLEKTCFKLCALSFVVGRFNHRLEKQRSKYKDQRTKFGACGRTRTYEATGTPDLQSGAIAAQPRMRKEFRIADFGLRNSILCTKKQMKAERWANEDTLRGTLLLRMATLGTLAKQRRCHPEGSLPSSFQVAQTLVCASQQTRDLGLVPPRKKVFQLSKNERSGLYASQGSCPLLTILAIFFEIWERESAPAN